MLLTENMATQIIAQYCFWKLELQPLGYVPSPKQSSCKLHACLSRASCGAMTITWSPNQIKCYPKFWRKSTLLTSKLLSVHPLNTFPHGISDISHSWEDNVTLAFDRCARIFVAIIQKLTKTINRIWRNSTFDIMTSMYCVSMLTS